ncbi:MAG: exonuclease SbcCD subunit D [Actinomycetota bacterium]
MNTPLVAAGFRRGPLRMGLDDPNFPPAAAKADFLSHPPSTVKGMVRFIHTADWQIGLGRKFLAPEARARYAEARCEAIAEIGRAVEATDAAFVLVCGDVFESNQVDRQVLRRSLEAVRAIPAPVLMLPGNHDALDPGSVYLSPTFQQSRPDNLHLLDGPTLEPVPGVDVVPVPWRTRKPLTDLVAETLARLPAPQGKVRVAAAHGRVDELAPDPDDPSLISVAGAERALADGVIHYLALGDRHSVTSVGATGRIWYSGTPEVTDFDEEMPGHVLVVELADGACTAQPRTIGKWTFTRHFADVSDQDLDGLRAWLDELPDKSRTALRLALRGTLSLAGRARLDELLEEYSELLAGLDVWEPQSDLCVLPDSLDADDLELSGFARTTLDHLVDVSGDGRDPVAAEALSLLYRLSRSA